MTARSRWSLLTPLLLMDTIGQMQPTRPDWTQNHWSNCRVLQAAVYVIIPRSSSGHVTLWLLRLILRCIKKMSSGNHIIGNAGFSSAHVYVGTVQGRLKFWSGIIYVIHEAISVFVDIPLFINFSFPLQHSCLQCSPLPHYEGHHFCSIHEPSHLNTLGCSKESLILLYWPIKYV